ncbi:hypothetical protein CEXT_14651 [Caerostris extrusa]|uniref:Uncharacterized protein n=1 Tax=Caerostris extrusa TaxID=172846 RepID=A0AAV4VG55_CAEEX|nr:hypothetical protein CEXT_14651 [Caerostris extrusa]
MVEPPHPNKPVENPANGAPDLDAIFGKKKQTAYSALVPAILISTLGLCFQFSLFVLTSCTGSSTCTSVILLTKSLYPWVRVKCTEDRLCQICKRNKYNVWNKKKKKNLL